MVTIPVRCPHCHSTEVIKASKQATGAKAGGRSVGRNVPEVPSERRSHRAGALRSLSLSFGTPHLRGRCADQLGLPRRTVPKPVRQDTEDRL